MKILVLVNHYYPSRDAITPIIGKICEFLVREGHRVTVLTSVPHYHLEEIPAGYRRKLFFFQCLNGVEVVRCRVFKSKKDNFISRICSYLSFNVLSFAAGLLLRPGGEKNNFDLVFTVGVPFTNLVEGHLLSRLYRAGHVINLQDIYPDIAVKLGALKNGLLVRLLHWLESYVYRRADRITVISRLFRDNLIKKKVDERRISVIPNFCDTRFISPRPRKNRFSEKYGLIRKYVVMYAGNIGQCQPLETVIKAAENLKENKDIIFLLVGSGARTGRLKSLCREKKLANVIFVPLRPWSEVPDILATADVSLVLLKKGLSFYTVPSKILSIMASARPVIAAVDSFSDACRIVESSGCGICIQPEAPELLTAAILKLYNEREQGKKMGLNGRNYVVKYYSVDRIVPRYGSVILAQN